MLGAHDPVPSGSRVVTTRDGGDAVIKPHRDLTSHRYTGRCANQIDGDQVGDCAVFLSYDVAKPLDSKLAMAPCQIPLRFATQAR